MKWMYRIGWPLIGLVCLGVAALAAIEAAKEEGINSSLLVLCAVLFVAGALGSAIKTKEAWSE